MRHITGAAAGTALASTALVLLAAACTSAGTGLAPESSPPGQPLPSTASVSPHTAVPPSAAPYAVLKPVHDPGHVTGALTGPCHLNGQLPDPRCTPGSYDPAVTQANIHQTICVRRYTATVRPPSGETARFKNDEAVPAYDLPSGTKGELDHLIPLELGGSNDASNLWIETGKIPNPKDAVETALRVAVCSGKISLVAAQNAIAVNWVTAEHALGLAISAPEMRKG